MNKLTIAHIVLSLECGGLEKLTLQLAQELEQDGVCAPVICLKPGGELIAEAHRRGLNVIVLNKHNGFDFCLIFKLYQCLRRLKVDCIHTHNFAPLIYGGLAGKLLGKPVINTRHGREDRRTKSWIWNLNYKVIAVSHDAEREMLKYNKIKANKVQTIYNGIQLSANLQRNDHCRLQLLKDLSIDDSAQLVVTVGRLSKEKDHKTLLHAFEQVLYSKPNTHLLIIGDGSLNSELKAQAKLLNSAENIHFLGFRDDIADILTLCHIFVLTSTMEGVSLTLLEAMNAGLPVVATDVGGNPEVVLNHKTGLLTPVGDIQNIADSLITLLNDISMAEKFGSEGRARAQKMFSITTMKNEYMALYREAVQ